MTNKYINIWVIFYLLFGMKCIHRKYWIRVESEWPRICSLVITHRTFHHSWYTTGFVTRVTVRLPLMEQELLILRSTRIQWGSCCSIFILFCVLLSRPLFVLFVLAIALSVFLRFTTSDYPFGIYIFFWHDNYLHTWRTLPC